MHRTLMTATVAAIILLFTACATTGSFGQLIDTIRPIVAEKGAKAANDYVDKMVADGKITADQAEALRKMIACLAGDSNRK